MAAKISTLCEVLFAYFTLVRSLHGMLAEVVAQVAALLEDGLAILVLADEVEVGALGLTVPDLDRLMPLVRDAFK